MGTSSLDFAAKALFYECQHNVPSLLHAVTYCFLVATAFVGSLYALVPADVRLLERDDPCQIQWRVFATTTVCVLSIFSYPFNFCRDNFSAPEYEESEPSVLELVGLFAGRRGFWNLFGALLHSAVLYIGPIFMLLLQIHVISRSSKIDSYFSVYYSVLIEPRMTMLTNPEGSVDKWIFIRNIIAAPVMEEIVFRGCIVPPLLRTGKFHPWTVACLAPLFFGTAHCHHAFLKLKQGEATSRVLLMTAFQFIYTSLFGAYSAHAFMRTRSILAVVLSHSFCNSMGLPSLHFLKKDSSLYPYRTILTAAHIFGIVGFAWGFSTSTFLPLANDPS